MNATVPSPLEGPGVVGIFPYVDVTVNAVRRLRERGLPAVRVHTPFPSHHILEESEPPAPSRVRLFSLLGGLSGTLSGFALTIYVGLKMNSFDGLLVSGKPPVSIPPYVVIAFELTVLFGSLATMLGFLIFARLPKWKPIAGYDAKFSDDRFGIFVACDRSRWEEVKGLLSEAGAEEVRVEPR